VLLPSKLFVKKVFTSLQVVTNFLCTLNTAGFTGEVVMITKENYLPYDRVKVSKQMDFEISKAQFRDDQFYKDNGIDILKVSSASKNICGYYT